MTKIAHIADTHLGYRQYGLIEREEDFYEAFRNIIDDIIKQDVDYVIHAGDLFEHSKPPVKALLEAQRGFEKLKEHNIPVYAIAGNHDMMQRSKTTIPQELFSNDNFHILSTKNYSVVLDDDIYLAGLPFLGREYQKTVAKRLMKIQEESEKYPYRILMLHGSIEKYFEIEPEFTLDMVPAGFNYYAMGHIHQKKEDRFKGGILSYPGSTERKSKAEAKEYNDGRTKGYSLITIDHVNDEIDYQFRHVKLKRKFILRNIDYPKLDISLNKLHDEILDIIDENQSNLPVVILNIRHGNFERSEVSEKIHEKLDDITLNIRIEYNPIDDMTDDIESYEEMNLEPEYFIRQRLTQELGSEEIATLGINLYKNLPENIDEAFLIAEDFFKEQYQIDENK